ESDGQLLEPILEQRVGWNEIDNGLRSGTGRQVAVKRRRNLRASEWSGRGDRDSGHILVRRAGLKRPRQRVDEQELDLCSSGPRWADVTVRRCSGRVLANRTARDR